jgi:hypothetical protein
MYVRISRGRFSPATEHNLQQIVEGELMPAMHALPGFEHYVGGVNRSMGTLCLVSLWDNEAHANFSRDVLRKAIAALTAVGVSLEPAEIYDVTLDVRIAPATVSRY